MEEEKIQDKKLPLIKNASKHITAKIYILFNIHHQPSIFRLPNTLTYTHIHPSNPSHLLLASTKSNECIVYINTDGVSRAGASSLASQLRAGEAAQGGKRAPTQHPAPSRPPITHRS